MYVDMKCVLTNDFMRSASPYPVHRRVELGGMTRFFPHALSSERRGEIIVFKLGNDESLYNS